MINHHLFLLDIFLYCLISIAIALPLYRLLRQGETVTNYSVEKISTEGFGLPEIIGTSLVVLLFSVNVWLPLLFPVASTQAAETNTSEILYLAGIVLTISIQFFFPTATLLFLHGAKRNILDSLGLRNCNWGKISFFILGGIFTSYAALSLLQGFGLEQWLTNHFGDLGDQAAVQAFKNANSPLRLGLIIITAVIVAPICEEILFRSFLYTILKKHTGMIFSVLISAAIFSVIHGNVKALKARYGPIF